MGEPDVIAEHGIESSGFVPGQAGRPLSEVTGAGTMAAARDGRDQALYPPSTGMIAPVM